MEITLKLEISERLHAIAERFAALAERYLDGNFPSATSPLEESVCPGETSVKSAEVPLESAEPPEAVNPPAEEANDAQAQTSCESEPVSDAPTDESPAEQEPDRPKSRRGRPRKAAVKAEPTETAEIAPQEPETVESVNPPTEDKSDAQTQASCTPVPVSEQPVAQPAEAVPDAPDADAQADPYNGMTLLGAVQSLLDEVRDKGLELADVNARVRKECSARSLPFSSAACLMKAVGYAQARRIVFGE